VVRRLIILCLLFAGAPQAAVANPGTVDRTFGADGVARLEGTTEVTAVTALRNGGVAYLAGNTINAPLLDFLGVTGLPRRFEGYRSFFKGADPSLRCGECKFVPAETGGIVVRLEGGDRRIAIVSRRLGSSADVRCLAAARRRCSGTLRLTGSRGSTIRRRIRLAPGTTRSALPRGLRRGARSITVEARAVDATGELFTALRTLRG